MHIHQRKLSQIVLLYGCRSRLITERETLHECSKKFCAMKFFMNAGWDAVAVEPSAHHKAGSLNDDDDASV